LKKLSKSGEGGLGDLGNEANRITSKRVVSSDEEIQEGKVRGGNETT